MAIRIIPKIGAIDYIGLSTDTKPTNCSPGSTFYETDTKQGYIFDGTAWCSL